VLYAAAHDMRRPRAAVVPGLLHRPRPVLAAVEADERVAREIQLALEFRDVVVRRDQLMPTLATNRVEGIAIDHESTNRVVAGIHACHGSSVAR